MKKLTIAALLLLFAFSCAFSSEGLLDPSDINGFDRTFMRSYDRTMDNVSTALQIAAMMTPAVLLGEKTDRYVTIGVMYAETVALTWVTTELIKVLADRPRPYMYFEGYPRNKVDDGDWSKSFPSGHTAFSFAGASFASYVFWKYNPDSKWRIPVTALSYSLAVSVAALRVASGSHFVTDVLAGALIGTAIGIAVPALHTLFADNDVAVSASPFGLAISWRYR